MDLKNLNTFVQVAEVNSFSRAAELLGYSQPTISVQIKQLEEELGMKLFDRIGHTVRLTESGRGVLVQAQHICRLCEEMGHSEEVEHTIRGNVRLGMGDSMCLALLKSHFGVFREQYPGISLSIRTGGTSELFRMLDHNEVDMIYILDNHVYDTNYVIAKEEKLGVHFVAPKGHPLAEKETISMEDLLDQSFLLTEKGMSYRHLLDEWLAASSREIQPVLEISNADLISTLVEKGMGLSFLPDYVTESAVKKGKIVRLEVEDFAPDLWKQLLHHRDKWISPQMQAAMECLTERF